MIPRGSRQAVDAIRPLSTKYAAAATDSQLTLSGPGAFSVEIGGRTAREASWIGTIDSLIFALLLWLAYRSWKAPLLGALPLASGGLAGLAAVTLCFDGVHGITVAFGFTLIGVAQDYPIHLFSHQRAGLSPWASARQLWPTLGTGVASTCIAYLTFLVSGVDGLQQLAVFTIFGLGVAALTTRFLLPGLIDPAPRDAADSARLARAWTRLARWPRIHALAYALLAGVAFAIAWWAPGAFWQNDLSKLTPVPAPALARDAQLRGELGAPDVRYLLALEGARHRGRVAGAGAPATGAAGPPRRRFDRRLRVRRPLSAEPGTQRMRQAKLPERAVLQRALNAAVEASPFAA